VLATNIVSAMRVNNLVSDQRRRIIPELAWIRG